MYNFESGTIVNKTNRLDHWLLEIKKRVCIEFKRKIFMGETVKIKIREISQQQFRLNFNFQKEDCFSLQEEKDIFKIVSNILQRSRLKCPKLKI